MDFASIEEIPVQVEVEELLRSRYESNIRPSSWDDRISGIDLIRTKDGRCVKLFSDGGQSPPKRGWMIVLRGGSAEGGYLWTLYGIAP